MKEPSRTSWGHFIRPKIFSVGTQIQESAFHSEESSKTTKFYQIY